MRLDFKIVIPPDVEPPNHSSKFGELTKGWMYNANRDYGIVYKACSSSIGHGDGWEKTTTQKSIGLYSTKELAMEAYRAALADAFERKLAEVDKMIEKGDY